jgi:hypothetical protein
VDISHARIAYCCIGLFWGVSCALKNKYFQLLKKNNNEKNPIPTTPCTVPFDRTGK